MVTTVLMTDRMNSPRLVKKIYFAEIGHFRDVIFDIIHAKVLMNTIPMMYVTYHWIKQVRSYSDFAFQK